jgi:hypothetical protein
MTWKPPYLTTNQQESVRIIRENPDGTITSFNPAKEANPDSVGNQSRNGFLYSPYFHPFGKFLQGKVKGSMLKCIDFVHSALLRYDPSAYNYDDIRLLELREVGRDSIEELFTDEADEDPFRKPFFLLKLLDIVLFLMKEDIYYRWRFIELMRRFGKTAEHLEPTGEELANLKR